MPTKLSITFCTFKMPNNFRNANNYVKLCVDTDRYITITIVPRKAIRANEEGGLNVNHEPRATLALCGLIRHSDYSIGCLSMAAHDLDAIISAGAVTPYNSFNKVYCCYNKDN